MAARRDDDPVSVSRSQGLLPILGSVPFIKRPILLRCRQKTRAPITAPQTIISVERVSIQRNKGSSTMLPSAASEEIRNVRLRASQLAMTSNPASHESPNTLPMLSLIHI